MEYFLSKFTEDLKKNCRQLFLVFLVTLASFYVSTIASKISSASPAFVFVPQGIVLATFILLGYRIWPAVFLGVLTNGLVFSTSAPLVSLAGAIANTAQGVAIVYALDRFRFQKTFQTTRDFVLFLSITAVFSIMVPTIYVFSHELYSVHVSNLAPVSWMHFWIAGLLSCVVLTPVILRWTVPFRHRLIAEWVEIIAVMALFIVTNYVITYTPISAVNGVSLTIPFFVLLLWIALRAGSRFITLVMVVSTAITFSGLFFGTHGQIASYHLPISEQIYNNQVTYIFIAMFYYILCTIEERRRAAVRELASYTEALKSSLSEKELDEETKNEFIAILGHEIRNPLAAILSSVELMKVIKDPVERERQLESVEDRIRSMARLLDDIFDISRITRRKLRLKTELVRARTVLRGAAESVESYMHKNGHRFITVYPDKTVLIEADPVRIEQIVINLLYNAAKYTPSGGMIHFMGTYEPSPSTPQLGTGQLVIRVRDTGVGLSEEEQEKIFEPYMQINPKQSLMGGIGLGLTLAKNLVEMHQGTIEVQSDGLGRGSEFIVRMPASIGIAPVKKEPVALPKPTPDSKKILVVDDNVDAARGMGKLLELHGHEVEVAHNGHDALEKAHKERPQGVILDIGLPDIDGYEVARRLRSYGSNSILIALSGYGHDDHKKKAREAGFDFFLTKPVSITEVIRILNSTPRSVMNSKKSNTNVKDRKYT